MAANVFLLKVREYKFEQMQRCHPSDDCHKRHLFRLYTTVCKRLLHQKGVNRHNREPFRGTSQSQQDGQLNPYRMEILT